MAEDKPANVLNLDAFKSEGENKPLPVKLGGKLFNMTHLNELDGFEILDTFTLGDVESTRELIKKALGDDYKEFRDKKPKKELLDHLQEMYLKHCGIDTGKSGD